MGKSRKLFKALVAGIKAFKSPSKEKPEKDKSATKGDKDHVKKKANKEKCLWSLGKSSSRNRNSIASAAPNLDAPEIKSVQVESKHVKDAPHTGCSLTSTPAYGPKGLVKAEATSFTGCDPVELVEQEELAAIKIQAAYRRHLVSQQVFRALRAVVRLQALARGRMVRKQASAALRCMQALVKVQALARGRCIRSSELGQLIQKHLQQTRQQRKKPVEGWVSSIGTVQQLQAKAQSKQDAVMKRQRALVYAFSEQLNRCTPKQYSFPANDFRPDKSHWSWVWLERWMAAHPWGNLPGVVKGQHNKEVTVKVKADVEVNEESYEKYTSPLKDHVGNSNIESTSSIDFGNDSLSNSQSAMEKEAMPSVEKMKEQNMHIPSHVEKAKTGDKSATQTSATNNDTGIKKATLPSPPPPPPPPPPLLYAKRANPVAHITSSHKGQQEAILANTCSEMPVAFEVPHLTSSARAAELLLETFTTTLATHLKSHSASEPVSPYLPSSPVKDSMQLTSANLPIEAFTAETKLQSCLDSPLPHNQSTLTTSSLTPETDEVLRELDMANVSMPTPSASDSAPISPSQPPSSPTVVSEVLVLSPQKPAVARSPLSIPDVTYVDGISNQDYTSEDNGNFIGGDRTTLAMEPTHGFGEGNVTMNPAESGSMDLKNDVVEVDMDIEVPESIDFKTDEVIQADSLLEANGGCDASVASAGEKCTDVSSSKHVSPVSKQGQHTEAGSPSVPNYMTTTKSSQAKIRTLTSLAQKSDSPKQKADSPKPRFDSSAKQKVNSPKQKLDSPKQKLDSPKQKLDSPKQKADSSTKRRHSLSVLEGKGSPEVLKSSPHVRASSKGQVASLKDTCAQNSPCSNGGSRKHGKPVAV